MLKQSAVVAWINIKLDKCVCIMFFIYSQTGMLTFGPKDNEELKEKLENLMKQGQSYELFTASEVGFLSGMT